MIYNNILETIGNTPIIRLNQMAPDHVDLFVKVESFNPMASVKDRLSHAIIMDAEQSGTLKPGQTVIEATSGNTGIALAMVWAAKGYPFVAVMAESFSIERRKIMHGLGAKLILTPAAERGTGMVRLAEKLADRRLDYWVSGYGTGGTMTGVGEVLKAARPDIKIIATEPAAAALLGGAEWAPHKIQGWTPDFIPGVLNRGVFDQLLPVTDDRAIEVAREIAAREGIFVGISAGATLATALEVAKEAPEGSAILAMLPNTGERYLSTPLFEGVNEGSDDDLLEAAA